jgi:hypothetical protein
MLARRALQNRLLSSVKPVVSAITEEAIRTLPCLIPRNLCRGLIPAQEAYPTSVR